MLHYLGVIRYYYCLLLYSFTDSRTNKLFEDFNVIIATIDLDDRLESMGKGLYSITVADVRAKVGLGINVDYSRAKVEATRGVRQPLDNYAICETQEHERKV